MEKKTLDPEKNINSKLGKVNRKKSLARCSSAEHGTKDSIELIFRQSAHDRTCETTSRIESACNQLGQDKLLQNIIRSQPGMQQQCESSSNSVKTLLVTKKGSMHIVLKGNTDKKE